MRQPTLQHIRWRVLSVVIASTWLVAAPFAVQAQSDWAVPGLGPTSPIKQLHTGFAFTEGPAAADDGAVFFTDIPNARIHKSDVDGKLTTVQEESGHANGLMFDASGLLVKCEMDGQVTRLSLSDHQQRAVATQYNGKRFNAPNDLVIDRQGGVYFTDPHFRAPDPLPQDTTAFYYVHPDGKVARLADDLQAPNGIILSPDEQTLYVIPSMQAEMMAYTVESPGRLSNGRVFCRLKQPAGSNNGGGDGLTIDESGNLYITTALGLQVYSPAGDLLGIIEFPEQPANVTFGGPNFDTLYVTARTSVYTAPMKIKGHRFARPDTAR